MKEIIALIIALIIGKDLASNLKKNSIMQNRIDF